MSFPYRHSSESWNLPFLLRAPYAIARPLDFAREGAAKRKKETRFQLSLE
ncbi:hypothetical protein RCO27_01335 [Sphingosinicella sp. LHD-64]|nr:hypothetical protein [Sphingosinicella sp. LHD-64]MDQ8754859.1 hypothetical protein [Sphingosinicella sp. LHD-64]